MADLGCGRNWPEQRCWSTNVFRVVRGERGRMIAVCDSNQLPRELYLRCNPAFPFIFFFLFSLLFPESFRTDEQRPENKRPPADEQTSPATYPVRLRVISQPSCRFFRTPPPSFFPTIDSNPGNGNHLG